MDKNEYLKIAKAYSLKRWDFDIVLYAGEEEGWHYFSCTREGRPRYSSLPTALRIDASGTIEEVGGAIRMKISSNANKLSQSSI